MGHGRAKALLHSGHSCELQHIHEPAVRLADKAGIRRGSLQAMNSSSPDGRIIQRADASAFAFEREQWLIR